VAFWGLMDGRLLTQQTLVGVIAGFAGGLGAAILVTALTPLAEYLLGRVTGLKLLELATHDQPLMRELALRAPGTYHHSMIMASLVESAAQSIQANPLLARVSAYYHDIGKMLKPHYFVENMPPGENRHDKLSPAMSSRVLKAHVKDGIELAKEHGLPQVLINAIPQHHGTSLIKFFYEKARESRDPEMDEVQELDYRYPGPKPQSRECALLMLADSVEAAGRVLSDPNRTRVQGAVQKIINNIFRDGQLDECDLTLRDLNKIARSFTDTLTAIYHGRIDYPEPVAKGETPRKKKGDEGPADQPADPRQDRSKRSGETPPDDLKRLGMS
jgi:putative nucleotidyltransferase with HDIG domain